MELTPDLLLDAKFGPSRRGYDMEEVDDFLERVAAALGELLRRFEEEFDRAETAEAEIALLRAELDEVRSAPAPAATQATPAESTEATPAVDPMAGRAEEAMRVLLHAERTAESVVAEARAEAAALTAEARTTAEAQRSEANALIERARSDAEIEARKAGESARRAVQDEVTGLRQERDSLAVDVRNLKRYLDEQRVRVRTAARDLQRIVDDPNALREVAEPLPDGLGDAASNGSAQRAEGADDGAPTEAVPIVPEAEGPDEHVVDVTAAASDEIDATVDSPA